MTEYQKTYIELKKQFVATNEGPDNVRALYTFKEELEQSEDQQAKEVLVDVYDLLDFKKDAYELLCQIGNRSDKKTLKRLGTLKDYAENWGNHYALPKKSEELVQKLCRLTSLHQAKQLQKFAALSSRVKPHNEKVYYIIDNIQTAIGNHQQIRFQYYEYTQEKKKILKHDGYYYVVNPYALEWKNDHYYLIGFSLKHQKIAHFRVDRLTSVENLETYFMPIEGFDVASYTNKMVDMFTSESSKEVTLLCENELMRVIIDHYGEDAAVDRYDDTHFTAKIEVNPSGTFYGWIFKFKGKIKILSPKECITEMQQIAQEFI